MSNYLLKVGRLCAAGGTVGFRTIMTRSKGTEATIDVNIPNVFKGKIKFNK